MAQEQVLPAIEHWHWNRHCAGYNLPASGAGAGSATDKDGLSGLTIQEGNYGGGAISVNNGGAGANGGINVDVKRSPVKFPPPTAYGMTIASTAESGRAT